MARRHADVATQFWIVFAPSADKALPPEILAVDGSSQPVCKTTLITNMCEHAMQVTRDKKRAPLHQTGLRCHRMGFHKCNIYARLRHKLDKQAARHYLLMSLSGPRQNLEGDSVFEFSVMGRIQMDLILPICAIFRKQRAQNGEGKADLKTDLEQFWKNQRRAAPAWGRCALELSVDGAVILICL